MQAWSWQRCRPALVWLLACSLAWALAWALAGCSPDGPAPVPQPQPQPQPKAAPADDAALLVLPELMDWVIDPAAAVVAAAVAQQGAAGFEPRSDEAWQAVADAAAQLQRASEQLAAPALARGQADWLQWNGALREGAAVGAAAARRRDPRGLYLAGMQLRSSCQACHARYAAHVAHVAADTAAHPAANTAAANTAAANPADPLALRQPP